MLKLKDEQWYTWFLEVEHIDGQTRKVATDTNRITMKAETSINALVTILGRLKQRDATVVKATLGFTSS